MFFFFKSYQFTSQNLHSIFTILQLATFILTSNHDTCRDVRDAYSGLDLVHILPARTTASICVYLQIFVANFHIRLF